MRKTDLDASIRLIDKYATAYFNRGHTYRMLGKHSLSNEDFQKAAELGYKDAETYLKKKPLTFQ